MVVVYRKKNFKVYDVGKGFIIHNSSLDFQNHHTHINNYNTCKYIINLSLHKTVPYHLSDYLLVSLIRLSNDKEYIENIERLLENNKKKRENKRKGKK